MSRDMGQSVVNRPNVARPDHLSSHFMSMEQQAHAAKLGMWVFLSTEMLLFGGLFVAYSYYRVVFGNAFRAGGEHLDVRIGTINTLVLIASSFAVAAASYFIQRGRRVRTSLALLLAIVLGVTFLGLKGLEWTAHFEEGSLPGPYYHLADLQVPGAALFFTLYFLMTGLHGLHVCIGVAVLAWIGILTVFGRIGQHYDTPLELAALYWHFVDVVWIFLYPLLYLQ